MTRSLSLILKFKNPDQAPTVFAINTTAIIFVSGWCRNGLVEFWNVDRVYAQESTVGQGTLVSTRFHSWDHVYTAPRITILYLLITHKFKAKKNIFIISTNSRRYFGLV